MNMTLSAQARSTELVVDENHLSGSNTSGMLALTLPVPHLPEIGLPRPILPPLVPPAYYYSPFYPWVPFRHFGFKNGTMFTGIDSYSTRPASGFMASGRFHTGYISVAAFEMEMMTTHDAEFFPNSGADLWDASLLGFYCAFRFGDPIFVKFKTGWRWRYIDTADRYSKYRGHSHTTMWFPGVNHVDSATVPYALGIGWYVGSHDIMEAEINYLDADLYLFSVAYIF